MNRQPTVTILQPSDGDTLFGNVQVSVDAHDDVRINYVVLYDFYTLVGTVFGNAGLYVFNWDTTRVANGPHLLSAAAIDSGGKRMVDRIWVTVQNSL